jgi:hypothetical protein
MRIATAFYAACAVLCATLSLGPLIHAQNSPGYSARKIFDLTNQDRQAHGLQPLQWDDTLAAAAQAHAELMASQRSLSHQYPGEEDLSARAARAGAHFQAIAENIAMAYSEESVERAWMNSPPHRANILDPRMNVLGVGVVQLGGTFFAVEDFASTAGNLSSMQIEGKVKALLLQDNVDPSRPRTAAAQACASSGYPSGETDGLVIRFDTADLSQLPSGLSTQIRNGRYRSASVAACAPPQRQNGFTMYRVAIVLY